MTGIRRHRLVAAMFTVAAMSMVVPACTTTARADGARWAPCPDNAGVECGTVAVPVDWAAPGGQKIKIAMARRAAGKPADRRGTLIYAPAGPGSSGVDAVANDQIFHLMFPPTLAAKFDVVSFDPRGVRRSHPVQCDGALVRELVGEPRSQAEFDKTLTTQTALGKSCRDRTGPLLDHLDSNNHARDLDAIRAALGEQSVNVYALSYGTVLGQMYAELFPNRIRTLVLDANVDHSASTTEIWLRSAHGAQESFDLFVDWCARSTACSLHGKNVKAIVADLYAKADAGTLSDPSDPSRALGRRGLTQQIIEPLGNAAFTMVPDRITKLIAAPSPHPGGTPNAGPDVIPLPIYINCADHHSSIDSYRELHSVETRTAALAPDMKAGWHNVPLLCANPPFPPTNPPHKLNVHGAPTILVTNSRYDDSTPLEGAERVAQQIGNATLVTYDGIGHGAATRGQCMRDVIASYFLDRVVPKPNTHCPAEPLP